MNPWIKRLPVVWAATCLLFSGTVAFAAEAQPAALYFRYRATNLDRTFVKPSQRLHHSPWSATHFALPRAGENYPRKRVVQNEWSPWGGIDPTWSTLVLEFAGPESISRVTGEIQLATAEDDKSIIHTLAFDEPGAIASFWIGPEYWREPAKSITTLRGNTALHAQMAEQAAPKAMDKPAAFGFFTNCPTGLGGLYSDPQIARMELAVLARLGVNGIGCPPDEATLKLAKEIGFSRFMSANVGALSAAAEREKKVLGEDFQRIELVNIFDEPGNDGFYALDKLPVEQFHAYLQARKLTPEDFAAKDWAAVTPLKSLDDAKKYAEEWGRKRGAGALRRYYWTMRFTQQYNAEHYGAMTRRIDELYPKGTPAFINFTDHVAMSSGMSGTAIDWFQIGLNRGNSMMWSEDWIYGSPRSWGGGMMQRVGFWVDLLRNAGDRHQLPVGYYNTFDQGENLRLKVLLGIGRGVKVVYFWNYGPTYMSTENYWSDNASMFEGVAKVVRDVAKADDLILPGKPAPAQVAIFYSTAGELFDPGNAEHEEDSFLHIALQQEQIPADVINEDILLERDLGRYRVIYVQAMHVTDACQAKLASWVKGGGTLVLGPAAGERNEYDEPVTTLAALRGFAATAATPAAEKVGFTWAADSGVKGMFDVYTPHRTMTVSENKARVLAQFADGSPAVLMQPAEKGAVYSYAYRPGVGFLRAVHAVNPGDQLTSIFPAEPRGVIALPCRARVERPVELSAPAVVAGLLSSDKGHALLLTNFTRKDISSMEVKVRVTGVSKVVSVEHGELKHKVADGCVVFSMAMGLTDIVSLRK